MNHMRQWVEAPAGALASWRSWRERRPPRGVLSRCPSPGDTWSKVDAVGNNPSALRDTACWVRGAWRAWSRSCSCFVFCVLCSQSGKHSPTGSLITAAEAGVMAVLCINPLFDINTVQVLSPKEKRLGFVAALQRTYSPRPRPRLRARPASQRALLRHYCPAANDSTRHQR